jgi:hypothetical protein
MSTGGGWVDELATGGGGVVADVMKTVHRWVSTWVLEDATKRNVPRRRLTAGRCELFFGFREESCV